MLHERVAIGIGALAYPIEIAGHDAHLLQRQPEIAQREGPDQRRHDAYLAFERWCADRRVPLRSLSSETFVEYREWLKNSPLTTLRQESLHSDLRRFWKEKSEAGVLAQFGLPRWNDDSRDNYGLARDLWPQGCKERFEAFERGARNQNREGEKRWRGPLRGVSIQHMEKEVAQFLGYLHNIRGALPDDATLLSALGDRKKVVEFIDWHIRDRCGGKEHAYHGNTLDQFATFLGWLGGNQKTVDHYRRIASTLDPVRVKDPFPERPMDYEEYVRGAMRALQEKKTEFENAKGKQARTRAACRYRDALILALLVCRPLRSRNIREMELGMNLYKEVDTWKLRFLRHQAKARHYVCDFPRQLADWLEFFLADVRPVLSENIKTKVVFLTKSGKPLTPQDLWRRLRQIGEEYLGLQTNPHMFRYLIPSAYLVKYPNALDQMQALLGHSTIQTTIRCYVHTYSQVASRKVAEKIREHCPNLTRLASLYPQQI